MRVCVWDNNGKWISFISPDAAPMVDDYINVDGYWYKVWRRFFVNRDELHIQLSYKLSPNDFPNFDS